MNDLIEQISAGIEGRYSIVRELGRGGMATVFLASDLRHDRLVAFKVLRSTVAEFDAVQRFLTEVRITARLHHPHILTLLDSGEADGYCYYVTPYMEGESLRQRLILEKQLPIDVALQLARQVASALDFAHRHGVVHRDIKPENVLLSSEMHAVVSDFGIARAMDAAGVPGTSHIAIGTMAYISPEQVMNSPDLDGRCDIYALGCMLFEMLAGRTPFIGISPQELADQQLNATPPAITSIRPLVPPEVAGIIARCLAKMPADRFSTGADLVAALASVGTMPTPTPPQGYSLWLPQTDTAPWLRAGVSAPSKAATRVARLRRWGPIVAVLAVALAASAGVLVWRRSTAATTQLKSSAPTHGASLAVLPFDNLAGGDEAQYFADGITEEIISRLSAVQGLKVISRTSVLALKRSSLTLPQIADTLGVRHILEGSVRKSGSTIRVTAQLIEANTDAHLWSETFDREAKDVFMVQDEIAHKVSRLLSSVVQGLGSMSEAARPSSSGAYDAYLQGKFLLNQASPEGLRGAVAALRRSIALDSTYAPAYGALASAYANMTALTALGSVDPYRVLALKRLLAEKAIQLDSAMADAYALRGEARALQFGDPDSTMADFRRALQLRPNAVLVHAGYSVGLAIFKNYDEAIEHAQQAVSLDPVSPEARLVFSGVAAAAGRWDIVLRQAQHARSLAGTLYIPNAYEAAALLHTGSAARCLQLQLGLWAPVRASCLYALGRRSEAVAMLDAAEQEAEKSGLNWVNTMAMSIAWAGIGNAAKWASWFERGVQVSPEVYFPLVLDSDLHDPIRNDPLFEATLARAREAIRTRFAAEFATLTVADALQ